MPSKPKVSILMPNYNGSKYIGEAIMSCENQDYENIEIIIVDDGSTDDSLKIITEYLNRYNNIKLFSQSNKGGCAARNLAFEKSTGDFIMYLDSDDLISHNKISSQVNLLRQKSQNDISFCQWGRFHKDIKDVSFPERLIYRDFPYGLEMIEYLLTTDMLQTSCWLVPRNIIEETGKWAENLTVNQDGEFFIRLLSNVEKIFFVKDAYVFYRSSDKNSISRKSITINKGVSLYESIKLIQNNLELKNLINKRIKGGLVRCYMSIAYEYYKYPSLVNKTKNQVKKIGTRPIGFSYGSSLFKMAIKLIGFWNTIKLKKLLF